MYVTIDDTDHVVAEYEVPRNPNQTHEGYRLVLVYDGQTEVYTVVWAPVGSDKYTLQWRGDFESCIKFIVDEAADFFADHIREMNNQLHERLQVKAS